MFLRPHHNVGSPAQYQPSCMPTVLLVRARIGPSQKPFSLRIFVDITLATNIPVAAPHHTEGENLPDGLYGENIWTSSKHHLGGAAGFGLVTIGLSVVVGFATDAG